MPAQAICLRFEDTKRKVTLDVKTRQLGNQSLHFDCSAVSKARLICHQDDHLGKPCSRYKEQLLYSAGHASVQTHIKEAIYLGSHDKLVAAESNDGFVLIHDGMPGQAICPSFCAYSIGHANVQTDINEAIFMGSHDELVAAESNNGFVFINDYQPGQDMCLSFCAFSAGHANVQTDIKEAIFMGSHDELVAAGSDDGFVFIYDAATGQVVKILQADEDVANCVQVSLSHVLLMPSIFCCYGFR